MKFFLGHPVYKNLSQFQSLGGFLFRGFKRLNFSPRVLIKIGSFMRVSNECSVLNPGPCKRFHNIFKLVLTAYNFLLKAMTAILMNKALAK